MKRYLPILDWLPGYNLATFWKDLPAGLTVGIMLIPQGMAYAMIAGLPPVFGLYAALLPQVIYAILGTSRQLAVGPVAMDSLLVASGLGALSISGIDDYIMMALFLALLMGGIQLLLGILRMGFLVRFLSKPVISGFTSAAALIIGLSQLKYLLGVDIERSNKIQELVVNAANSIQDTHLLTLAIGLGGILLLLTIKKWFKKIPGALVLVVLGTALVYGFRLDRFGVSIVGSVPSGLPEFGIPTVSSSEVLDLLPIAATLALIAFMEAISVAKAVEEGHDDYKVVPNQELIALGASNIVGSLFGSYPVTGGFSRTAVNNQAGAKTGMAAVISAGVVLLTLLFLTPLFYFLPKALLASIIMVAVFGLIDFKYPARLWRLQKDEFALTILTFVVTLTVGITEGIGFGVFLSMVLMVYRNSKPHIAEIARIKGTDIYRNIERFPEAVEAPRDMLILRFDSQLFFGNQEEFHTALMEKVAMRNPNTIVLDASSIHHVDSSGILKLSQVVKELRAMEIRLVITNLIGPVRDLFYKSHLAQMIQPENIFATIPEAIQAIEGDQHDKAIKSLIGNQTYVTQGTFR